MKATKEFVDAFMKLSTPTVSDAMDKLGIRGGCEGLMPIVVGKKFVGPAFTVKFIPVGTVKTKAGDFIDEAKEGDVIVIDNAGRTWCTVWGDILTYVAVKKRIAGTVIDGVCRDVDGIRELDYPMYTKGHFMVTGKDRVMMESMNEPVSICDVQVKPGDLVMADQSGVLIIPIDKAEEILQTAVMINETEEKIIEEIKNGSTLVAARKKLKYDTLQRPGE
ncbi:MAG: Demethylmenaquinone methyltransferase-like protein [Firmicutes bacterium]|nr:Demethylmenaquinone methyltransferase-like protein [Bacillota bacterium]MDI6705575.1 RraA family protein [Bacillota bacterium]